MTALFGTNWKMRNVDHATARAYVRTVANAIPQLGDVTIFILPPVTLIRDMAQECTDERILIGAQDVHWADEGEYTGELSTNLLKQEGAKILMVGHAERRTLFGETDEVINRKLKRALGDGFRAVLCVGDADRDASPAALRDTFRRQLQVALDGVAAPSLSRLIVAYEPYWAIGAAAAGAPAPDRVAASVEMIRQALRDSFNGAQVPVLYGGSVAPDNCRPLVTRTGVDGLFVGRAARDPDRFVALILDALQAAQGK